MHLKFHQMCYTDKKSETKRHINGLNWNYLLTALNATKHTQSKAKWLTWDLTELKNSLIMDSNILTDQVIRYYFYDKTVISDNFLKINQAIEHYIAKSNGFLDRIAKNVCEQNDFTYHSFVKIANNLVFDKITWIKISGLFALYAKLSEYCYTVGKKTLVASAATYIGRFLSQNTNMLKFFVENAAKDNIFKNMIPIQSGEVIIRRTKKNLIGFLMLASSFSWTLI